VASSFAIPQFSGRGRRETLADYLAAGPPSLTSALHCATAIAGALRDLHEEGRAFGALTLSTVLLSDSGTTLELPMNSESQAPQHADIQAFGAILNDLMIRSVGAPGGTATAATSRSSPLGIRAAGARLAGRCMAAKKDSPGIQQVVTEVRLLYVMARQNEADPLAAQTPAASVEWSPLEAVEPPAAPFVMNPQPKPEAYQPVVPQPVPHPVKPALRSAAEQPEMAPVVPLQPSNFGKPQHHDSPETQRADGKCPKCDSSEVYVSRPRSKFETMLVRWKFPLCRCHRCYHRWLVLFGMSIAKDMPIGTKGRSFKQTKRPHRRH
jgi:DNA-directed RNA polymerase subunit M/transcription elongation factor TFIIS